MNLSEIKEIRVTEQEAERVAMMRGDILVVEGHGNPEEVGRCAVWRGEIEGCLHQNHLIRVRANNARVLPEFLSFYLNSPSGRASLIRSGKTTSGLSTISTSNVKGVPLFIPPLELQDRFSSLVEDIGSVRQKAERQLEVAEATFQSLLHRAFSGELSA